MSPMALIIEDDELQGGLLKSVLKRLECEVVHTKWARKGIQFAKESSFDFILLDLNLPDMHGLETIDELKDNPKTEHIPIIVITGSDFGEDKSLAWAAGCAGYVHKPFKPSEIRGYLREFIGTLPTKAKSDASSSSQDEAIAMEAKKILAEDDSASQTNFVSEESAKKSSPADTP